MGRGAGVKGYTITTFTVPGALQTFAGNLSDDGEVVGTNVGLIQTELNATLTGNGVDGVTPPTTTLAGAQEAYLTMINGGPCS